MGHSGPLRGAELAAARAALVLRIEAGDHSALAEFLVLNEGSVTSFEWSDPPNGKADVWLEGKSLESFLDDLRALDALLGGAATRRSPGTRRTSP